MNALLSNIGRNSIHTFPTKARVESLARKHELSLWQFFMSLDGIGETMAKELMAYYGERLPPHRERCPLCGSLV